MPKILKYHDASPYPPMIITGMALVLAILFTWIFGSRLIVLEKTATAAQTNYLINTDATP